MRTVVTGREMTVLGPVKIRHIEWDLLDLADALYFVVRAIEMTLCHWCRTSKVTYRTCGLCAMARADQDARFRTNIVAPVMLSWDDVSLLERCLPVEDKLEGTRAHALRLRARAALEVIGAEQNSRRGTGPRRRCPCSGCSRLPEAEGGSE